MALAGRSRSETFARLLLVLVLSMALGGAAALLPASMPARTGVPMSAQLLQLAVTATASPSTVDVGQSVSFVCSAGGGVGGYSYAWDFGDGATGSGASTSHAYASPGAITATCTATDSLLDTGSGTAAVTVNAPPSVHASATPALALTGASITFSAVASGGSGTYSSYAWSFGDGGSGSGSSVVHAYSAAGAYTAQATVTDSLGGTGSGSASVTIEAPISVQATVDHSAAAPGATLSFTAAASGGSGTYSSYAWAMGNGGSGSGSQTSYAYSSPGAYTATVSVTDSQGNTGSGSVAVTITSVSPSGSASPSSGSVGTSFTFTATATGGAGGPYTFSWNFGDGSTATGSSVSHAYSSAGTYTPSVRATDPLGASGTSTLQSVVVASSVLPLSVAAQASPSSADAGQTVQFTCNATGGLPPYSYSWSFGDGASATGFSVTHAYSTGGTFTATCSVTDVLTDQASSTALVKVSPALTAKASVDHSTAAPGSLLTFTASGTSGSGSYVSYAWDFGDGGSGSGASAQHAYGGPGSYTATVVVTDSNGGTARASVSVTLSFVTVHAYVSATFGAPGTTLNFTAFASGGAGAPYTYAWAFGDGATASGDAVTHAYSGPGNFTPTLRVTDPLGAGNVSTLATIEVLSSTWTPGGPINATILVSIAHPMANESVAVQALGHGGTGAILCSWDFGDSNTTTGCSVNHAWKRPGNFTVTLTVSDASGNQTRKVTQVSVEAALVAAFLLNPGPVAGQSVSLQAQVSGGSGSFNCTWDFGDTNQSSGCAVTHAWMNPGNYLVVLTVVDSQGHRIQDSVQQYVPPNAGQASASWVLLVLVAAGMVFVLVIAFVVRWGREKRPASGEGTELSQYLSDLERFSEERGERKAAIPRRSASPPGRREEAAQPSLRSTVSNLASSWAGGVRSLGTHLLGTESQPRSRESQERPSSEDREAPRRRPPEPPG